MDVEPKDEKNIEPDKKTEKRKRLDGDTNGDDMKRLLQLKDEERMIFKRIGLVMDPEYVRLSNILVSGSFDHWIDARRQCSAALQIPDILRNIFEFLDVLEPKTHARMIFTFYLGHVCKKWGKFILNSLRSLYIPHSKVVGFNLNWFTRSINLKSIVSISCYNPVVFCAFLSRLEYFKKDINTFNPKEIEFESGQLEGWRSTRPKINPKTFEWKPLLKKAQCKIQIPLRFQDAIKLNWTDKTNEIRPLGSSRCRNRLWTEMNDILYEKKK